MSPCAEGLFFCLSIPVQYLCTVLPDASMMVQTEHGKLQQAYSVTKVSKFSWLVPAGDSIRVTESVVSRLSISKSLVEDIETYRLSRRLKMVN